MVAATGCQDVIDLDPVDERAPREAAVRPKPISGGTLTVMDDGIAVAADPDRDLVHVVDLDEHRVQHTIALSAGDEPGRVAQGSGQRVHVILRGFGGIATLDRQQGTVLARQRLCADPRGLAFAQDTAMLHVACADGTLVHLDEASGLELDREVLEPDLRDVVVGPDGALYISQFRSATILEEDGGRVLIPERDRRVPHVAWRTWAFQDSIAMLHQLASTRPVPIDPKPELSSEGLPYGGGGEHCEPGIASTAFTFIEDGNVTTIPIPGARLAVDAAISPDGDWVALAMPGAEEGQPTVGVTGFGEGCFLISPERPDEQITSVAFEPGGKLVMQSREPARLLLQSDMPDGRISVIELPGESRYDTGHEIFHRATESGLSCATCHPEGTDDGHVWTFEGLGPRRTQALDIGLEGTAPFHWDGDMGDLDVLMGEVLAHRMGGKQQSPARRESFTRWMFEQQRPVADTGRDDPALVQSGKELFVALRCDSCHTGAALGGTMTAPIRGTELQVPSLHRVSLRPPFMHDGRSPTLEHAVLDMIESTTSAEFSLHDVEALSAYMRTL